MIAIASLLLAACTEEIEIELDSTYDRIVIDGAISNELKRHTISVKKSAGYFSNAPAEPIVDALVLLEDGENSFLLTEEEPGIYKTDSIAGKLGKTYTLSVEAEGTNYIASSKLNTAPPVDSIRFKKSGWEPDYIDIKIYTLEPETPNNFYLWLVYKNGVLETDTLDEYMFYDDSFVNGNYIQGMEVQSVKAEIGDTITLETRSINEGYYNYIINILGETTWNGGPFDAPPANVAGNFSNGALGYFRAYSSVKTTNVIKVLDKKNSRL